MILYLNDFNKKALEAKLKRKAYLTQSIQIWFSTASDSISFTKMKVLLFGFGIPISTFCQAKPLIDKSEDKIYYFANGTIMINDILWYNLKSLCVTHYPLTEGRTDRLEVWSLDDIFFHTHVFLELYNTQYEISSRRIILMILVKNSNSHASYYPT